MQTKVQAPIAELNKLLESGAHISETLDHDVLKFLGVFVLKNALNPTTTNNYAAAYFKDLEGPQLKKTDYHLTEVKIDKEHSLRKIIAEPEFLKVAKHFFEGNVGSDFVRIVKKDRANFKSVFRHQDTGYQIGTFERYSLFIALTPCNFDNGGLVLFPGTHNFGYLGDAGEIADILPAGYPKVAPSLDPGDILIMHSGTWHESPENKSLTDRVYLEVHIQNINECSTRFPICGTRNSTWQLELVEDEIFKGSRTQRIRGLYKEIEELKKAGHAS